MLIESKQDTVPRALTSVISFKPCNNHVRQAVFHDLYNKTGLEKLRNFLKDL